MPDTPPDDNVRFQTIWGIALVAMGIGVFFRIPQVMPRIAEIETFASAGMFIRFCFYFLGGALIYGGGRKLARLHGRNERNKPEEPN